MPYKKRQDRLQVMLNEDELEAIDEWRYENCMPARSAAIRALIRLGMARSDRQPLDVHHAPSSRIGVLEIDPALGDFPNLRRGKTVLVVEDEYLIARGIKDVVEDAGYEILGPVADSATALELIERHRPEGAVLDIKLADALAVGIAQELHRKGIPFLFCTAYRASDILPPEFRHAVVVDKPRAQKDLPAALEKLLG